jgi:OB-fold nucleic acid binding domain
MGEVAEAVGRFVTAYSGDLRDETLDGQRVVVGGIVTGIRTVITKARATMAIVTMEDLQGTVEVVVFPRTWEETARTWAEGAILLVAGRIDHRGEEISLLADLVVEWESAVAAGPETFARQVAAGERGRGGSRRGAAGLGAYGSSSNGSSSNGSGNGHRPTPQDPPGPFAPVGVASDGVMYVGAASGGGTSGGPSDGAPGRSSRASSVEYVSPLRAEARSAVGPPIAPAEPIPTYDEPPDLAAAMGERDDEPPLPDEARLRASGASAAPTAPTEATSDRILHVRFLHAAGTDRLVGAMEEVRMLLRARPGVTRVVLHLPQSGGHEPLPMELRTRVAYDAELLAEMSRLGNGIVDLQLA